LVHWNPAWKSGTTITGHDRLNCAQATFAPLNAFGEMAEILARIGISLIGLPRHDMADAKIKQAALH